MDCCAAYPISRIINYSIATVIVLLLFYHIYHILPYRYIHHSLLISYFHMSPSARTICSKPVKRTDRSFTCCICKLISHFSCSDNSDCNGFFILQPLNNWVCVQCSTAKSKTPLKSNTMSLTSNDDGLKAIEVSNTKLVNSQAAEFSKLHDGRTSTFIWLSNCASS